MDSMKAVEIEPRPTAAKPMGFWGEADAEVCARAWGRRMEAAARVESLVKSRRFIGPSEGVEIRSRNDNRIDGQEYRVATR
jgi:hypothetical protein